MQKLRAVLLEVINLWHSLFKIHNILNLWFLMGLYSGLQEKTYFYVWHQKFICPTNVNFYIIVMLLNVLISAPVRLSTP